MFDVGLALSHRRIRVKCMENRPWSLQLKKLRRNTTWTGIRLKQLQSSYLIQLYRMLKGRNIRGKFSLSPRVLVNVQVVWIGILISAKNFWMRRRHWVNGRLWRFMPWLFRQLEGILKIIGQKRSRKNSSLISNGVLRSISTVVRRKHCRCLSIMIGG